MTFTWQSESIEDDVGNGYYVSITQDAYSNILDVQAWKCDKYGLCKVKLNEYSYHKNDMAKAKATYRRYVRKYRKEIKND